MKKRKRNNFKPTFRENGMPFIVIFGSVLMMGLTQWFFKDGELLNPYIGSSVVQAQAVPTPTPTPIPTPTPLLKKLKPKNASQEQVVEYIHEVFGKDSDDALTVSHCESKYRSGIVGDKALTLYDAISDEMVGDSIGVFQIRTGGKGWNRARANGLTAEEFRTKLKDYKYNIDYAKSIFDRQGWYPWTCKKDL